MLKYGLRVLHGLTFHADPNLTGSLWKETKTNTRKINLKEIKLKKQCRETEGGRQGESEEGREEELVRLSFIRYTWIQNIKTMFIRIVIYQTLKNQP